MNEIEHLEQLLEDFISAVHRVEWKEGRMPVMKSFPVGCCTVASFLLGHLLQDRGLGKWQIINALKDGTSLEYHDWLRSESGIQIDATVHQFEQLGVRPFVIRGPSPLEESFTPERVVPLTDWTQAHRNAYAILLAELPKHD